MTQKESKDTQISYMTIRQFSNKYRFKGYAALRVYIYNHPEFRDKCVRRFGRTLLIDEKKALDFIDKSLV